MLFDEEALAMRSLMLWISVVLAVVGAAAADTRIDMVEKVGTQVVYGEEVPSWEEAVTYWFGDDRLRLDRGGVSFIVRADEGRMYVVNQATRSCDVRPLSPTAAADEEADVEPTTSESVVGVTVTPMEETRTIGGLETRRYDLVIQALGVQQRQVMWVATEVGFDLDAYRRLSRPILALRPGWERVVEALDQIPGMPILVEGMSRFGGSELRTSTELVAVAETEAPEGLYDPPETCFPTPAADQPEAQGEDGEGSGSASSESPQG